MATLEEQETTVTFGRREEYAYIYTSDARHLWRLREDPRAEEINGVEDWANFRVPMAKVNPLKFFKTVRVMTDEQKQAAAARLAEARARKES